MAFIPAGESEARRKALLQNQQLESASVNIIGGLKNIAQTDIDARKAALLAQEKQQERIDKANAAEGLANEKFNLEMRQREFDSEKLAQEMQFKKDELEYKRDDLKQKKDLADADNKAKIEAARIGAGARVQAQQNKNAQTGGVSPYEYKETKEVSNYDKNAEKVSSDYSELTKTPLEESAIPSFFGGSREKYQSQLSNISANLVGKFPGIRSDADFRNIIVPMLPSKGETPAVAAEKARQFREFLVSNRPAAPILESKGMYGNPTYEPNAAGPSLEEKKAAIRAARSR